MQIRPVVDRPGCACNVLPMQMTRALGMSCLPDVYLTGSVLQAGDLVGVTCTGSWGGVCSSANDRCMWQVLVNRSLRSGF